MSRSKRIITSALPYVNNLPHLGNVVGSLLSGDVFSRFSKIAGHDVLFVSGTDEYGTASEVSADRRGVSPSELCKENSSKHKEIYDWFKVECCVFGRTSDPRHAQNTQKLFLEMHGNKCFSEKTELRYFCSKCAMFLADRYVSGTCSHCGSVQARGDQCDGCGMLLHPDEVLNPTCATCGNSPQKKETSHLFYDLQRFEQVVGKCISENAPKWSPAAKKIAGEWAKKGLQPRSITRDLKYKWGVPVPLPGYEEKVLYVWFDAPLGYITFSEMAGKGAWWEEKETELYEFMGKDNVFFHSVFFPALLLGAGQMLKYPKIISSTYYLTYEGGKFSKSENRGIFGADLLGDALGPEGVWRFHLMRARPETNDADFSWTDFHESLHAILINKIGNLCHRVLSYISNKMGGVLAECRLPEETRASLDSQLQKYIEHMEKTEIKQAVACVVEIAQTGNGYMQKIFDHKSSKQETQANVSAAANILLLLARTLYPITPTEAVALHEMLGVSGHIALKPAFIEDLSAGHIISKPNILFRPLTSEQVANLSRHTNISEMFRVPTARRK